MMLSVIIVLWRQQNNVSSKHAEEVTALFLALSSACGLSLRLYTVPTIFIYKGNVYLAWKAKHGVKYGHQALALLFSVAC